jgi:hypothetical protein
MGSDETERRLKATEVLDAENAIEIFYLTGGKVVCPALVEYARVLKGAG